MRRFGTAILLMLLVTAPLFAQGQGVGNRRELVRAEYGWGSQWIDVTDRVASLIREDYTLRFRVDNDTLGFDPAPDRDKTLRLYLRNRQGRTSMLSFAEERYVNLRRIYSTYQDAGNYGRDLRILRATYGYGSRSFDVTSRLQRQIYNDQINLRVTNETMGGDPAVGADKALTVLYSANGRRDQVVVREGDYLRLSGSGMGQGGDPYNRDLQILRATYGSDSQSIDVTDRLQRQIRNGQVNLRVTNVTMGGDPAADGHNHLTVHYSFNGRASQVVVNEGDYLRLPSDVARYDDHNLQILRATYGYGSRSFDVTDRLQRQVHNDRLDLRVTNDSMGGDPAVNQEKTLTVQYSFSGRTNQVVVREGDYLRLPDATVSYSEGDLQILRATYGDGSRQFDVTSRLQRQIYNDRIDLRVTNETMGGDPAVGEEKSLTVLYSANGRRDQVVVREGDYLRISGSGVSSGGGDYYNRDLQILRAIYGYGSRSFDVTDRLQRQIYNDQINLRVTNETMGGDPAVGEEKTLTVQFSANGRRDQVVVREGDYLRLSGSGNGYQGSAIIPRGTELKIRTNERIDSKEANVGQTFSATLEDDVRDASGRVAIQRRSDVALVIRSTSGNDLVLDIDSLMVGGERYYVSTEDVEREGGRSKRKTAVLVGGGAVAGAIIGAIIGGGKGAAIGAGVGAGAGAVGSVLTGGKEVRVPAETLLTFRLDQDLRLGF